ncbi:hypothetical protein PAXINDRAFT_100449 [Paxillus involutus ATCC 200175]|uniref:Uncharacterized protein n=1 Tax=Paxillus involutus ATCC 200175 TaxID=664439 RepID=A0A0C9SWK5_PAXIN|nr:hypothetical protein PAXINDRAFT_100449 [Paxillus involutus ATCC 200175]
MAQLIRSAKSGSDWSGNELFAFNIVIQDVDAATFFGVPQLPATTVSPVILNNLARPPPPAVVTKEERIFFEFLNRANISEVAAVDDFATHILRILDFDDNERSITTKREMSFTMCGARVRANALLLTYKTSTKSYALTTFQAKNHAGQTNSAPNDRGTQNTTTEKKELLHKRFHRLCPPCIQFPSPSCVLHGPWAMLFKTSVVISVFLRAK